MDLYFQPIGETEKLEFSEIVNNCVTLKPNDSFASSSQHYKLVFLVSVVSLNSFLEIRMDLCHSVSVGRDGMLMEGRRRFQDLEPAPCQSCDHEQLSQLHWP